jgi:hypothetical protein
MPTDKNVRGVFEYQGDDLDALPCSPVELSLPRSRFANMAESGVYECDPTERNMT